MSTASVAFLPHLHRSIERLPATGEPATGDIDYAPAEPLAMLGESDDDLDAAAARHTDNKLQTTLPSAALNLCLREAFRQARLSMLIPAHADQ